MKEIIVQEVEFRKSKTSAGKSGKTENHTANSGFTDAGAAVDGDEDLPF